MVFMAAAGLGLASQSGPAEPERVCARPEELRIRRGITLSAEALRAFRQAERLAGHRIKIVQSYRSCREQARACQRICGNRRGCPQTCAPPGLSWHQRGAAIDVSEAMLEAPGVVQALERAGWCQSVPKNDPGHFSFGGCH